MRADAGFFLFPADYLGQHVSRAQGAASPGPEQSGAAARTFRSGLPRRRRLICFHASLSESVRRSRSPDADGKPYALSALYAARRIASLTASAARVPTAS